MSTVDSDYADLADMFALLGTLDPGSQAFERQREAIIQRCLPLASNIARRYTNRGEPFDDLVQAARLGLVNAVNRFDADRGQHFLSFAVPTIMGEVRRHFRDHGWAVKVPRACKELRPRLTRARSELSQVLGRAPNASEIAEYLEIDREKVVDGQIASSNYAAMCLDAPYGSDDGQTSIAATLGHIDPGMEKVLQVETVRPLIAALPEREQTALRLRFFEDLSQTQIGERLGVSQMHVSRLLAKALNDLRTRALGSDLAATA